MLMAKVKLQNDSGVVKEIKVGFSWTTLFFGAWVALFRGQWGEVVKWFLLNPITLGIWGLVQCWTTNKKHAILYLEKGYKPLSDSDKKELTKRGIIG
jgi:hypothetical protein